MSAMLTSTGRILYLPEDKSCAVVFNPPQEGKADDYGSFSDALKTHGLRDETARPMDEARATEFLRGQVISLARTWGDPPPENASQDDLIKWVNDTCLNPKPLS